MKALIADDDCATRRWLEATLSKWGHDVEAVADGAQAWEKLRRQSIPPLVLLNWMMPGMEGVGVCRRVRELAGLRPLYLIMLTARDRKSDIVDGLAAGADDYVTKPFDVEELQARVHAGERTVGLQLELTERVTELEATVSRMKRLQAMLPICIHCKRVRDGENYWQEIDAYIGQNSAARFSHGVCPDCHSRLAELNDAAFEVCEVRDAD